MAFDYEQLYRETPHALGQPTKAFVDFFEGFSGDRVRVLDVGCGQGRDALFIARLGHRVVAVDLSPAGISGLISDATCESLDIKAEVADICTYRPDGLFDIIVVDRTLHMLQKPDRSRVLSNLVRHVSRKGHLLLADEPSNMSGFRQVLAASSTQWVVDKDARGLLFARRVD